MAGSEESRLSARLQRIGDRLQEIANLEARGAIIGSGAADGQLEPERDRLIAETEGIVDRLEAMYRNA